MKKTAVCFIFTLFFTSFALTTSAQTVHPDQWSSWINDTSKNLVVIDTFRVQNFESSALDTWEYTLTGKGASLANASLNGITGQNGNYSVWLPAGSGIVFAPLTISAYEAVQTRINYVGKDLAVSQKLLYSSIQDNIAISDQFQDPNTDGSFKSRTMSKVNLIHIYVDEATPPQGGFYVDNVFSYGKIAGNSLFTGAGNWNDSIRWSHLPPARLRKALVAGNVTVTNNQQVSGLKIGQGSVKVDEGARLTIDSTLVLYHTAQHKSEFINKGTLVAKDKVQLVTSFPQKGVWRFISFPFDVYANGIDPRFILKDDQTTTNGNYLYAQIYDASKRAETGTESSNWKPVPASLGTGDQLVFQKNKGYLIAIDEASTDTLLTFTSRSGAIPSDFGKEVQLSVPHYSYQENAGSPHSGWYLSGNPFPSPMSVSQLPAGTSLGNFIYWYNGSTYEVFDAGGSGVIPAYGAFFFKTTAQTDVSLKTRDLPVVKGEAFSSSNSFIGITLQGAKYNDRTEVRFIPEATTHIDQAYDAYKLTSLLNESPQIATECRSNLLAVNAQPLEGDKIVIPIHLRIPSLDSYTLNFNADSFDSDQYTVQLADKQTGKLTDVARNKSYSFASGTADDSDRFELILQKTLLTEIEDVTPAKFGIEGKTLVATNVPVKGTARVMLLTGQTIWNQVLPAGSSRTDLTLNKGTYILQVGFGRILEQQLFIIAQ